jgi:hypothetical protein
MRIGLVLGLVLVAAAPAAARDSKLVALHDVPDEARQAADRAAPGVNWIIAKQDSKGGYMIIGKNADRQLVEFLTDAEGKKYAVRIHIPLDHVPEVVRAALKNRMPGFKPKSVQACGLEAQSITVYRFQGPGYEGGNAGVYVSASGKRVSPITD